MEWTLLAYHRHTAIFLENSQKKNSLNHKSNDLEVHNPAAPEQVGLQNLDSLDEREEDIEEQQLYLQEHSSQELSNLTGRNE